MNNNIKKFEFRDLSKNTIENTNNTVIDTNDFNVELNHFADQNSIIDVGQSLEETNPNLITITKEELDAMLNKVQQESENDFLTRIEIAKNDAVEEYIKTQGSIIKEEKIAKIVQDIKNTIDVEIHGLLEKIVNLSYNIASKIVNIYSSKEYIVQSITNAIKKLNFHDNITVEVSNDELAQILSENGIEVLVKNDMLNNDYKIIWCHGFLEKNTLDIISQIEEILIDQVKEYKNDTRI